MNITFRTCCNITIAILSFLECLTADTMNTDRKKPCVFPFEYNGLTYTGCTMKDSSRLWCATKSVYDTSHYGYCSDGCLTHSDTEERKFTVASTKFTI